VTIFLCFVRSRDDLQPDKRNDRTHVRSRDAQCIKSDLMRRGYWAGVAYAAAPADALKTSPVVSMLCMMTESFLATATAARLKPRRSRSFVPQFLRLLSAQVPVLVRITTAAS